MRLPLLLALLAACGPDPDDGADTDVVPAETEAVDSDPPDSDATDSDATGETDTDDVDTDPFDADSDTDVVVPPGPVDHDPDHTLVLHVHGWILDGVNETDPYGPVEGGGPIVDGVRTYGGLPHMLEAPTASNAVFGTSYYGGPPPADFTAAEVARVDALEGVPRYATIVAIRARHQLAAAPDATGLTLTCHSMGCEVERFLIENDVEELVSDGLIKRWVTFAGVVNGADLATRLGGPAVYLNLLGIDPIDVDHMAYAWVRQNVAVFDHVRTEGNNPALHGILVHHLMATKPTFDDAFGLPLLDLANPNRRPNDGILWTDDEAFTAQAEHARVVLADGSTASATRTYVHAEHFEIRDVQPAWVTGAAAVVGRRRVDVRVTRVRWTGRDEAVSELALEASTRWPWVEATHGEDVVVDERTIEHRVAALGVVDQDDVVVDLPLHAAVVFDAMDEVRVDLTALEADVYPAKGVREGGRNEAVGTATVTLPLVTGDTEVTVGPAVLTVHVDVRGL